MQSKVLAVISRLQRNRTERCRICVSFESTAPKSTCSVSLIGCYIPFSLIQTSSNGNGPSLGIMDRLVLIRRCQHLRDHG